MAMNSKAFLFLILACPMASLSCTTEEQSAVATTAYRGICDASAVVMLDDTYFAVADDESNALRVYARARGGLAVTSLDLSAFLQINPKSPEADLEGAARIGDRIYWISSHGRNVRGKERLNRQRFFATTGTVSNNGGIDLKPVGRPYLRLLEDLLSEPRLARFGLAAAATRAPKSMGALNIEGLSETPAGHLLIGFRNPIPRGRALLVPLLNPAEMVAGQPARFGDPLLLDLDGLGIRSMTYRNGRYLIIAGAYDGSGRSQLYEWRGDASKPRRIEAAELRGLIPEAIAFYQEHGLERLLVISDDGTRKVGGIDCKNLKDPNLKSFRAVSVTPATSAHAGIASPISPP